MQTPFDSVLRLQQRALETIRRSLIAETAHQMAIESERTALETALARESAVAASDWQVGAHPYGQRLRARRSGLDDDRRGSDARLDRLRDAAMEACGQNQAVTGAANDFTSKRRRHESAAEQAQADDLVGARRGHPRRVALSAR